MYLKKMNELIGKTYNYWTVLEARPNKRKGHVLAKCICGKEKVVRGRSITTGISKSCGYLRKETSRKRLRILGSKPALKRIYSFYRTKAINRNLGFTLSIEGFEKITSSNCFYCNKVPINKMKTNSNTDTYIYNGIDRLDNSKGYIQGNVQPCCYECNTLKGGITKDMIFKLYEWFKNDA